MNTLLENVKWPDRKNDFLIILSLIANLVAAIMFTVIIFYQISEASNVVLILYLHFGLSVL
jgi:hypothetical protein